MERCYTCGRSKPLPYRVGSRCIHRHGDAQTCRGDYQSPVLPRCDVCTCGRSKPLPYRGWVTVAYIVTGTHKPVGAIINRPFCHGAMLYMREEQAPPLPVVGNRCMHRHGNAQIVGAIINRPFCHGAMLPRRDVEDAVPYKVPICSHRHGSICRGRPPGRPARHGAKMHKRTVRGHSDLWSHSVPTNAP